jgi:hypothetical protein
LQGACGGLENSKISEREGTFRESDVYQIAYFKRSATPPKYIDDFEILIFRPDVCPKSINCWNST